MSSKMGGLRAIANALNEGDVARAQIATVLLGIPDLPVLSKGACSPADLRKFVDELKWSGLLKSDWDPDEHPRWPAGAPDSQGGQFAPKGDQPTSGQTDVAAPRSLREMPPDAVSSARRRFYGADVPSNIQTALQIDDDGTPSSILDGSGQPAGDVSTPKIAEYMQATAAISAVCNWLPPRSRWKASGSPKQIRRIGQT